MSLLRAATKAPRTIGFAKREFSALLTPVEEFPSLPSTNPSPSTASTASVTTLPSGLTIVTEDASSLSTVSITYPNAGSASEGPSESGAALVNKNLAFKSGSGLSSALILRNLEDDGATPFSSASRDSATIGFTAMPDKAARLVPLLATTCSFEKWDIIDAVKLSKIEVADAETNAGTVFSEAIFSAAYGAQSPYGKPYFNVASKASIQSFRERAYGLSGAVLSATGVSDHESFVKAVEEGLSDSIVPSSSGGTSSEFIAGETRCHDGSASFANVALGFKLETSVALAKVVQQCFQLSGVNGFTTTGMVGVYSGCSASDAVSTVDELCAAVTSAPSADIVKRAKALAKAEALFGLEDGSQSLANVMASNVLASGSFSAGGLAKAYDSISDKDVADAIGAISKSRPAMAAVGNVSDVPYHGSIVSRFA